MTNFNTLPASIANLVKPTAYFSCAETAKLVRKALKEAFPEIKFAVRSSVYAGGASIDVRWHMGPLASQVEAVAKRFAGARFDGMTDTKGYVSHAVDGQSTHFGADFIFCERDLDAGKVAGLADILARADRDQWITLAARYGLAQDTLRWLSFNMDTREAAAAMLRVLPVPGYEGRRSRTADAVTMLSRE